MKKHHKEWPTTPLNPSTSGPEKERFISLLGLHEKKFRQAQSHSTTTAVRGSSESQSIPSRAVLQVSITGNIAGLLGVLLGGVTEQVGREHPSQQLVLRFLNLLRLVQH